MRRFIRYDHLGNQVGEVSANDIMGLVRREVINGEHSLKVTTFQVLSKNERIVYEDGRGIWREYVVEGVDEEHASGKRQIGTYYCVWSVQPDLMGVPVSVMPGTQTPVSAGTALTAALSAQGRWARGTVTNTAFSGASMYDTSTWKALGILVKNWGGELSTTIGVSSDGVISRAVDLYDKMGEQEAKRRYDFGADVRGVKRKIPDAPLYCRISPRGKGEQSGSGWGRKVTIESVNYGKDYLEYAPMVDACKLPDGEGGYLYPTLIVENGDCDTPAKLKAWAQGVLEGYCTPKVTYTIDVVQAASAGIDMHGVSLGDAVHVVDRYFGDGLRLSGRVVELVVDELEEHDVSVKIGGAEESISERFAELDAIRSTVEAINGGTMATADYLNRLIERINGEVNAAGGYTYITEGEGLRTYDAAVSDPLVGSEASAVVEIKGGTIRIANTRTAQGEWEWKTVFTSGHIAADLVTAAHITAGYIGSAGDTYIDLDGGTVQLGSSSKVHAVFNANSLDILSWLQEEMAHFGYGTTQGPSGTETTPYYTLGTRTENSVIGSFSLVEGYENTASGGESHAEGWRTTASGQHSHAEGSSTTASKPESHAEGYFATASGSASHAEGRSTTASGDYSHAEGWSNKAKGENSHAEGYMTTASGDSSHAEGFLTVANGAYQHASGIHNIANYYHLLIVGNGSSSESGAASNAMYLTTVGNLWIAGTLTQNSDRRLKEHHAYLGEDAVEFVRGLKPALYTKDGARHVGFYAQDVQEAEPDGWGTATVEAQHTDESLDFDPLTLDYTALIAPIVAYAQSLEKRIEQLEQRMTAMEGDADGC